MEGTRVHRRPTAGLHLRLAIAVAVAVAMVSTLTAPAQGAQRSIHHSRYWSWTGPANWVASYGPYGITITSPDGPGLDLGFSSILCTPSSSVRGSAVRYFAQQRSNLSRGATILSKTKISSIGRLGPNYFRQTVNIANRLHGERYLGQVVYDYQVSDPTYCYQRSIIFGAPAQGFASSLNQLLHVFGSLAYFGPGAYEDTMRR